MGNFIINCNIYYNNLNIKYKYMISEEADYYYTYENIYNYNNYGKILILLFIILFLIYIFSVIKKFN
jgi:hypothetical protein